MFVEPRLVADTPDLRISGLEMRLWLGQLGNDMFADGFYPVFVEATVYSGPVHQDGRTLLAMRRFLKDVYQAYPLTATLLVGSLPDASIVRSVLVKNRSTSANPENLTAGTQPNPSYAGDYLALESEYITPRADIVLGDLDGNWESLYRQPKTTFTSYRVAPLMKLWCIGKGIQTWNAAF